MIAYRIARAKYIDDLSGTGARKAGGRWNLIGVPILYLAQSRALAMVELLGHVQVKTMPLDFQLAEIDFPGELVADLAVALPNRWDAIPTSPETAHIGSDWVASQASLVLKVPSAHVQEEYNYLVNPLHPRSSEVRVVATRPFAFDARLLPR